MKKYKGTQIYYLKGFKQVMSYKECTIGEQHNSHLLTSIQMFVLGALTLLMGACMPINSAEVNTDLFKNKEDMKTRAAELKPGMHKKDVFEKLGISPEKFENMSTEQVQISLYGNSQLQGSLSDLELFKKRMMSYDGYALPYSDVDSNGSIGLGKMKVRRTGHDLRLVVIFEKDKLLKVAVEGQQTVNQKEDQYIWDGLVKKGLFSAF